VTRLVRRRQPIAAERGSSRAGEPITIPAPARDRMESDALRPVVRPVLPVLQVLQVWPVSLPLR